MVLKGKGEFKINHKPFVRIITVSAFSTALAIILSIGYPSPLSAKVTGPCSNCHTMHNSQDGSDVLRTGAGVGWDNLNQLSGGSLQSTPAGRLLVTDCVWITAACK